MTMERDLPDAPDKVPQPTRVTPCTRVHVYQEGGKRNSVQARKSKYQHSNSSNSSSFQKVISSKVPPTPPRRMSFDTFSAALKHLQPHTTYPTPQIYTHLANLLNQYSTGLSLPITLDSLSELSKPPPPPPFIEATVVATHPTPTIHVLKVANRYVAFYPPSNYPSLPLSTTIRIPLPKPSAEAISLAIRCIKDYHITKAVLPTQSTAIQLPFKHQLPNPEPSYTLFSIWQNHDLTPPAVYATLIEKHLKHSSLILVDNPQSPSIEFKLSRARESLLHVLPFPCIILVTAPAVTPTDNSFVLHDTPLSTFFYQPLPDVNKCNKRERASSSDTLYKDTDLDHLSRCHDLQPIIIHVRVEKVEPGVELRVRTCENVSITVPHGDYQRGDELLLKHVIYQKRWIAEHVTNISTMQGILYCPFIRNFVSINQAMQLCRNNGYTTAQIKVSVNTAVRQAQFLRLSVVDSGQPYRCGALYVHMRGFERLFALSRQFFLSLENDAVQESVNRISGVVWLMNVTCGVADLPVLTACLRGA